MAFRKKGMRPIHVDGVDYYWKAGGKYAGAEGATVTIMQQDGVRSLIIYPENERPKGAWGNHTPEDQFRPDESNWVVIPSDVAYFIRLALHNGWKPDKKGSASIIQLHLQEMDGQPLIPLTQSDSNQN